MTQEFAFDWASEEADSGCCLKCSDSAEGCLCFKCKCKKCYWYDKLDGIDGKGFCEKANKMRTSSVRCPNCDCSMHRLINDDFVDWGCWSGMHYFRTGWLVARGLL